MELKDALVKDLPNDRVVQSIELHEELQNTPAQEFFASGNTYLDSLIGGFAEGDLIMLGGSPKSGKTTLLQTWTKQFARQKINCLWFSIELSNREFIKRFGSDLPVFFLPRVMPSQTTHQWLEQKIIEAKKVHDIKVVFIDHIGMIMDEATARERNQVDIMDARLMRLKRFAIEQKVALIVVGTFVTASLRKKKTEPSTGDFKGTGMVGYTADSLLGLDRLIGQRTVTTVNEAGGVANELLDALEMTSDAYLYVLDSRRTGMRKVRIRMTLDSSGDYKEA